MERNVKTKPELHWIEPVLFFKGDLTKVILIPGKFKQVNVFIFSSEKKNQSIKKRL